MEEKEEIKATLECLEELTEKKLSKYWKNYGLSYTEHSPGKSTRLLN